MISQSYPFSRRGNTISQKECYILLGEDPPLTPPRRGSVGSVGGVGRGKEGKIYTKQLIIVKNKLLILVTI
ncbi:hypothetical protein [Okeania sp. SIO1I7]|uniref:hypothetical protein n=1 Tax=Okeania sp. SIO1I7 TaxID=2607772 RepID=UPI0013FB3672|nr:hypothetical protein [Okeania sp. SIO1I7]NET30177.1 hypothetical protein [Okeania sp. SIO1I7]